MNKDEAVNSKVQSTFEFMGDVETGITPVRLGIVGVTGIVGEKLLDVLKEQTFPIKELRVFASGKSQSSFIESPFGTLAVETLNIRQVPELDIVFLAAGAEAARKWGWRFARRDTIVIDKSSYFRDKSYAPLVVPEVNETSLELGQYIYSNPNCATIPIVHALKPLHDQFVLKGFTAVTFQSVSGAGKKGVAAYEQESNGDSYEESPFPEQIVGNVIPWIGDSEDLRSDEEKKVIAESRKILGLPRLPIRVTCVRVPVHTGHSAAIHANFRNIVDLDTAINLLTSFPGLELIDQPEKVVFPTPLKSVGTNKTFVGRVRCDRGRKGLALWISADNLRKGAAYNAVQIAQSLLKRSDS